MSQNLPVSVLMPAYNAEKHIAESIESILNQTYKKFELIIADDGSEDGTWNIIQAFVAKDPRIIAFQNRKNSGISFTRNELLHRARGEFIAWQDSDDISLDYRVEHQLEFMTLHPDVVICGGFLEFFKKNQVTSIRKYASADADLRKTIFHYSPVAQPAAMLKLEVALRVGGFDESLRQAEDLDLSFKMGKFGNFSNLQEVVLRYRQGDQSISVRKLKENIKQTLVVRKRANEVYGYPMSLSAKLVFIVTYFFQFLPSPLTTLVFNLVRNR